MLSLPVQFRVNTVISDTHFHGDSASSSLAWSCCALGVPEAVVPLMLGWGLHGFPALLRVDVSL